MTSSPSHIAVPVAATALPGARLDFSRCLADAGAVYRRNFWKLVLAAVLSDVLSIVTLLILAGPLAGGWCLMTLNALSRADRKVDLGVLFGGSYRFGALLVVFILSGLAQLAGLMAFIVPGLFILTLWLFPFHLVVDRGLGPIQALAASARIVRMRGLGPNFMLAVLVFLLVTLPMFVPYVGFVLGWLLSPLGWLLVSAAYIQEVRETGGESGDALPHGFPVQPVPLGGPASPS